MLRTIGLLACLAVFVAGSAVLPVSVDWASAQSSVSPVGLSLFFQNGTMTPITLVGGSARYLQEIDIVATSVPSALDQGIQPLIQSGDFASLNWNGISMVEEDWRSPDGVTFMRQRFYRGAKWMTQPSTFELQPLNSSGAAVGNPLITNAGSDDQWKNNDDGFVRRFVARQIATGCPAINDCTGATFVAQGLAQLRGALNAENDARSIPASATQLRLTWNHDLGRTRTVQVSRADESAFPYGYGFAISLDRVSVPANGTFFLPGDTVTFRVTFSDGQSRRLHPEGSLPTYNQFASGQVASGLSYYDGFRISPTLYYALKHREANLTVNLSGPTDRLKVPKGTVGLDQFFIPQAVAASVPLDGFTAVVAGIPPLSVTFGGLFDPSVWDTPVSDLVTFQIPGDALPGTYVATIKARREFGGEALNKAATADIQVGTAMLTSFNPTTGPCNTCHNASSALSNILHGLGDRRGCFGCHPALVFEPDAALDIRVHEVHDRSKRFPADVRNCSICHLTPPSGPARGLLSP